MILRLGRRMNIPSGSSAGYSVGSAVAGRMPKGRFAAVAVEVMKAAREIERTLRT